MNETEYTLENVPIECPECGQLSSSIKHYTLPHYLIFVGFAAFWQRINYTCCPKCMLKHILIKCFTYNIAAANVMFPFVVLPWGIIYLLRNMTDGHSSEVVDILRQNNPEK